MSYKLNIRLLLAFLVTLILTILPLPQVISGFRPPWVLMLTLYIQFYFPKYFSLIVVIVMGILLDVLLSTMLGENVFALVITTWIASSRVRRFHLISIPQQMALITMLSFLYQCILYGVDSYQGFSHSILNVLGTTFISFIIWPWLSLLLGHYFYINTRKSTKHAKERILPNKRHPNLS